MPSPTPVPSICDTLTLRDGTTLRLRPIGPGDRSALRAFFEALGDESRARRFLGPKPMLRPRELAHLTDVDHAAREALAAFDGGGAIVAEARYAAWPARAGAAEFAIAIRDDLQGRGLGSVLAAAVVARARANGFALLTASTLWENRAARALLRRAGFRATGADGGVLELELALQSSSPRSAAA